MGRIIGIDLGTTNSVGAYWRGRRARPVYTATGSPFIPSVVMVEGGNRVVGSDARDQIGRSGNIVYSIKRFIGRSYDDKEVQHALGNLDLGYAVRRASNGEVEVELDNNYYSPVEISSMILGKIKEEAELTLGDSVTHAVITVPAYFGQPQKDATRRAGDLAGLNVSRIINEPTAAALAFGVEAQNQAPRLVLVYDLGGGTFDVSILMISGGEFDVLQIDGDNLLGGDDFDQRLVEEMLCGIKGHDRDDLLEDHAVRYQLKQEAEKAKIQLSRVAQTRILRPAITQTDDGRPVDLDLTISRDRYEILVGDLVQRSIDITLRALDDGGFDVTDVDDVLLVGGMTRMPLIRGKLKEIFGERVQIDIDPMQCVGLGAAVQTTVPIDWLCPNCQGVNDGADDVCHACGHGRQAEEDHDHEKARIICDACGRANDQGRRTCWNCGAALGAVFAGGRTARIQDIIPKHLGIETEDGSGFAKVIKKGALYPTDEPHRRELYTSNLGQEECRMPVYELERESTPREEWERIGEVVNANLPPGLPLGTPIMVEMSIDGDGVLTVQSYVKKDRDRTLSKKSFRFFADLGPEERESTEALETISAFSMALRAIARNESIAKYLSDETTKKEALNLADEADNLVRRRDKVRAPQLRDRILEFVSQLPVPTWDLFLADFAANAPQTSALDRSQVERSVADMEKAVTEGNLDRANRHLDQLRQQTERLFGQLPSDLLRQTR